jgi:thiamine biosynthesis lipoprotein
MKNIVLFFLLIVLLGCTSNPKWVKNQNIGSALGTSFSIIYIADKPLDFQKEIDSVFMAINQSMSTYIPDSDISKINNGDSTIVVDEMFKEVLAISTLVYNDSKGYFDPSIGVLANAWGFGPGEQIKMDSTTVDSLLHFVGWNKVKLNSNGTIHKSSPNLRFDFNAVAKGYAIDRLGKLLLEKGIENYLVEVGGEVIALGQNLVSGKKWTVGIDQPNNFMKRGTAAIVHLENKAMASSGNYRKFRYDEETGDKYVHTINPKTGFTKNSSVLAATVFAKDCATADAYATAFMAMDLEDSRQLLKSKKDIDAYIIYIDESNNRNEFMTSGFEELLVK